MIYRWMAFSGLILAAWGGPDIPQHALAGTATLATVSGADVGEWDKKWDSWGGQKKGGWWN